MELTIREAAVLTGRNERTLRSQLVRGEIVGRKCDGRWMIDRSALPLTDSQRSALEARAAVVRDAVAEALPRSRSPEGKRPRRSALDFDAFRAGKKILDVLTARVRSDPSSERASRAVQFLDRGLMRMCEGLYAYDLPSKVRALRAARAFISRSIACIFFAASDGPSVVAPSEIALLETEVLPAIGGLLRWSEKRAESRR